MSKDRYQDISDKELLERFLSSHNSEWLGGLLQRYTLLVFGVCYKYLKEESEAKDAVQQIFLKVIQELPKYKVDYFKSWLYMVTKNYCLTVLRNKKGKIALPLTDVEADDLKDADISPQKKDAITDAMLQSALNDLNAEQNECVTLFYLKKMSYQKVSEVTGFSLMQVKSYIQNGKRNLKLNLEKKLKEHPGNA